MSRAQTTSEQRASRIWPATPPDVEPMLHADAAARGFLVPALAGAAAGGVVLGVVLTVLVARLLAG